MRANERKEGTMSETRIRRAYELARERYAEQGVDAEAAMRAVDALPISIHCWQGDDVGGFERAGAELSGGGIQVTGNHPGKARDVPELRADIEAAARLCPGPKRLNLHAIYGEFGSAAVDRDRLEPAHFSGWIDWARERGLALDFNATLFSHPLAAEGFTLSHRDAGVREFWIEHARRARRVAAAMGRAQRSPCVHNLWIPDGSKDHPADRAGFRARLIESLDAVYAERHDPGELEDSVEGKLFGIGSEAFVVGSNDFYLGYAATRRLFLTLDMGHFHPTESVADKVSALLPFLPGLLLHVSRGVRWDSDHVVAQDEALTDLCRELARSSALSRVRMGLDYFDGSIDRVGAWAVGYRAARKALLAAFLEPRPALLEAEAAGDGFQRLALLENAKAAPWGAVWDEYCLRSSVPPDEALVAGVEAYARGVLAKRS